MDGCGADVGDKEGDGKRALGEDGEIEGAGGLISLADTSDAVSTDALIAALADSNWRAIVALRVKGFFDELAFFDHGLTFGSFSFEPMASSSMSHICCRRAASAAASAAACFSASVSTATIAVVGAGSPTNCHWCARRMCV